MQRRRFLTTAGLLGSAAGLMSRLALAQPEPPPTERAPMNRFGIELYHQLRRRPGNLFVSPLSIAVALSMTAAGAAGKTLAEMEQTLHLDTEGGQQALRRLMAAVNAEPEQQAAETQANPPGIQLRLANAIYVQQGYTLRREFQNLVAGNYDAALESLDFRADADAAAAQINRWVRMQTQGKIQQLFAPGALDAMTRLVLANAIYFKGKWQAEFDPDRTRPEPFTLAAGAKVNVPMMHHKGDYPLLETPEFQLLEMPYQAEQTSMLVLLPRRVGALAELEQKLTPQQWMQWSTQLTQVSDLQLAIPRFKLESEYTLNETLQTMGIRDAFDASQADFSGMVSERPDEGRLAISTVVHKAFCEVNEEGTEAAAATGVAIGITSFVEREPKVFKADHPFLFAICHRPTGSLLFLGRVNNPAA